MNSRIVALLAIGAVLLATLGFSAGRWLHPDSGTAYSFDTSAPALEPVTAAAISKGGFTGFSEGADARTVLSGRVVAATATSLTLQRADGTTTTLRLSDQSPLRGLEASDRRAIQPGAQVLVHGDGGTAAAVLVLAPQ